MRHSDARVALAAAVALITAGTVWLWGPYGLIGSGVVLAGLVLFVFNVEESAGGEVLAEPARTRDRGPLHR